ncbi:UDP-glucose 4-epimerase [Hortaea werneckii]|nr:UDP-glucose 4-epimerase [Hortaea werneckii]
MPLLYYYPLSILAQSAPSRSSWLLSLSATMSDPSNDMTCRFLLRTHPNPTSDLGNSLVGRWYSAWRTECWSRTKVPPLDAGKVQQYSGLFERSGAQNGLLDGGTAKSIFERAGLPNETLGRIWMLCDREQRGALDQTEFIIAMHLLTSTKMRAMTALPSALPPGLYEAASRRGAPAAPPGRPGGPPQAIPPQFTGGSTGAPPRTQSPMTRAPGYGTPPPQAAAQPMAAQSTGGSVPWLVTQQEKTKYDQFFATIDTQNTGIINGEQAVRFFSDSRLPEDTLASIWDLADINSEGQLNRDEFAVAMYLIRQQRSTNPPPLPAFLPPALVPPSMRQQQQSQQSTAPTFDNAANQSNLPKSATEDLFGLDEPSPPQPQQAQPAQPFQPALQPQETGTSVSRDPFAGSAPASPSSPRNLQSPQQQPGGQSTMFKPFTPTSAFGASLAQQNTGGSATSSQGAQGQARGAFPQQPQPSHLQQASTANDDLLGDSEAQGEESSKMTNETMELANMSSQIGNLRNQMESTQQKKATSQADLSATQKQKQDLEQRLQQFRAQYETEVRTVKELETQLVSSRESTKKLSQELAMLEGTYQDLSTQHASIAQQLQTDQAENANLKQRISAVNAEVGRLKPEIEKMKMDARQQRGMVSINKKQLATNEVHLLLKKLLGLARLHLVRTRLRKAVNKLRVHLPHPEVAWLAPGTDGSLDRGLSPQPTGGSTASGGPNPSAFDALFGPSAAFAPTGQAGSRTGTPPATSFIGRSIPPSSAAGQSASSVGEPTPSATPPPGEQMRDGPNQGEQIPPPPPTERQFTPGQLPITALTDRTREDTEVASTAAMPPESRAGGADTPGEQGPMPGAFGAEREPTPAPENVPGAFPGEDGAQPVSTHATGQSSKDDFDSAFAGFGEGANDKDAGADPFAEAGDSAQSQQKHSRGFSTEFPPIRNLEPEDDDSSDDDSEDGNSGAGANDDSNSAVASGAAAGVAAGAGAAGVSSMLAPDGTMSGRPGVQSVPSNASSLPEFDNAAKQPSPPAYEQSDDAAHGGSGERTSSNQFPPQYGGLLPSREDPTSPPPPDGEPPEEAVAEAKEVTSPAPAAEPQQPQQQGLAPQTPSTTDVFHDANSRPMSSVTDAATPEQTTQTAPAQPPAQQKNAFDDFDDFDDLSEAKEADKSEELGFGSQSQTDEFNPAFDSPAASMTNTMTSSHQTPNPSNRGMDSSNSFSGFGAAASSSSPFDSSSSSAQNTSSNDWDAIFSGLDNSKNIDTSLGGSDDPWGAAPATNGTAEKTPTASSPVSTVKAPAPTSGHQNPGGALSPGTEHDDPFLKRLTGMGYPRQEALNALEKYDYDMNKAIDHLTGEDDVSCVYCIFLHSRCYITLIYPSVSFAGAGLKTCNAGFGIQRAFWGLSILVDTSPEENEQWPQVLKSMLSENTDNDLKIRENATLVILPPVMFLLEAQHLADLAVAHGRLIFAHLTPDRRVGLEALEDGLDGLLGGGGGVGGVEDLEAQAVLLDAKVADLAQVARVDVGPGVAPPRLRLVDDGGEVAGVLVRLDHVADGERVDVVAVAPVEGARRALAAQLRQRVRVHRVAVVVLLQREAGVVGLAFGEADAVGGLGRRDDDLLHAQLRAGFDDVVRGRDVLLEALVVRNQQVAGDGAEVDDDIRWAFGIALFVAIEVVVGGQGIVDLATVGEVGLERVDIGLWVGEVGDIQIQNPVSLGLQVGDHMTAGFATAAGEDDALALRSHAGVSSSGDAGGGVEQGT